MPAVESPAPYLREIGVVGVHQPDPRSPQTEGRWATYCGRLLELMDLEGWERPPARLKLCQDCVSIRALGRTSGIRTEPSS